MSPTKGNLSKSTYYLLMNLTMSLVRIVILAQSNTLIFLKKNYLVFIAILFFTTLAKANDLPRLNYLKKVSTKAFLSKQEQDTIIDTTLVYSAEINNFTGSMAVGNGLRNLDGVGEQGKENTVFGIDAGKELTSGKYNTIVGYLAGAKLSDDQQNIPFGSGTNSATGNVFIGRRVASVAKHALDNTIVGTQAGGNLTDGMDNVLMGIWAGLMIEGGSENVGLGHASLLNVRGYGNYEDGNGHRNTAVGDMSARFLNGSMENKTGGKSSVYVGARTTSAGNDVINENVIGYKAQGKGSNTVVIGNDSIEGTWIAGAPHFPGIQSTSKRPNVHIDPISGELQQVMVNRTEGYQDYAPNYYASTGEFGSEVITKKARYNYDGDTVNFMVDCLVPAKGTADGVLIITLPIPASGPWMFSAYEHNISGVLLRASASGPQLKYSNIDGPEFTTVRIVHAGALGNIISGNRRFVVSGSYEALKTPINAAPTGSNKNEIKKTTESVVKNVSNDEIEFYPNPVEEFLSFKGENLKQIPTFKIYDMSGKLVYEKNNPFLHTNQIDVQQLKSGHYIINFDEKSIKIIKK